MPHDPALAVVWLDFHQAKIFLIKAEDIEAKRIKADTPNPRFHHRAAAASATTAPIRGHPCPRRNDAESATLGNHNRLRPPTPQLRRHQYRRPVGCAPPVIEMGGIKLRWRDRSYAGDGSRSSRLPPIIKYVTQAMTATPMTNTSTNLSE